MKSTVWPCRAHTQNGRERKETNEPGKENIIMKNGDGNADNEKDNEEGREEQGGRISVQQEGLWDGGVEAKTEDEKAPTWQNSFQVEGTVGIALFLVFKFTSGATTHSTVHIGQLWVTVCPKKPGDDPPTNTSVFTSLTFYFSYCTET